MKRLNAEERADLALEITAKIAEAVAVVVGTPALLFFALWLGENVI